MSTQKGNVHKSRPPKYKNTVAYKNSLHDTSKRTKEMNSLTMSSLCARCKGILEWKVKYKKYKPLTQPTVCLKCNQKTVKRAYYTVCAPCIESLGVCGKCGTQAELVIPTEPKSQNEINLEFEAELKRLRERERRTLLRCATKQTSKQTRDSDGSAIDSIGSDTDTNSASFTVPSPQKSPGRTRDLSTSLEASVHLLRVVDSSNEEAGDSDYGDDDGDD